MKKIGIIFPGYGEQKITMGKSVYDSSRIVQDYFEHASDCTGINFVHLLFASSDRKIKSIYPGYLAIFVLECALFQYFKTFSIPVQMVAGYGLGEYAATVASGSLSFEDGLYLLKKYAEIYQSYVLQHKSISMLSVPQGFSVKTIEALCDELRKENNDKDNTIFVAAYNNESNFYVSGDRTVLEKFKLYALKKKIRKIKLIGPEYGIHSEQVTIVAENIAPYFHKIKFKPLNIPIITNVDGDFVANEAALQKAMIDRVNHKILWKQCMSHFSDCDIIISMGPGEKIVSWAKEMYEKEGRTILFHALQENNDFDFFI